MSPCSVTQRASAHQRPPAAALGKDCVASAMCMNGYAPGGLLLNMLWLACLVVASRLELFLLWMCACCHVIPAGSFRG